MRQLGYPGHCRHSVVGGKNRGCSVPGVSVQPGDCRSGGVEASTMVDISKAMRWPGRGVCWMRCNSRDSRSAVLGGVLGQPDWCSLVVAGVGGSGGVSCQSRDYEGTGDGEGGSEAIAIGAAITVAVGRTDVAGDSEKTGVELQKWKEYDKILMCVGHLTPNSIDFGIQRHLLKINVSVYVGYTKWCI